MYQNSDGIKHLLISYIFMDLDKDVLALDANASLVKRLFFLFPAIGVHYQYHGEQHSTC